MGAMNAYPYSLGNECGMGIHSKRAKGGLFRRGTILLFFLPS